MGFSVTAAQVEKAIHETGNQQRAVEYLMSHMDAGHEPDWWAEGVPPPKEASCAQLNCAPV